MSAPSKFLFDVDFTRGPERQATVPLAEHATRLAEAETAAHRRGYAEGKAEAAAEAERRIAAALEHIASGLAAAGAAFKTIEARLECEAVEVAVAVARKLAPAMIAREPFAEISELASECFREHIAARVNDALYSAAREKLEAIARAAGFEGRLVVLAEPGIALGDCRIEWADGGAHRDSAATETAIADAVARYVSARRGFADSQEILRRSANE